MMCNPIYYQTRFDLEREKEERKEAQSKKKSDATCRKNQAKEREKNPNRYNNIYCIIM